MNHNFVEDPRVQQAAEAYALEAVDLAGNNFEIGLDWSDDSVVHVERILGVFHDQFATSLLTEEQIFRIAKQCGSYVGEVFRRNHGATWGLVTLEGQSFPGLQTAGPAGLFWPWGRAQNRLTDGPSNNIWNYYQFLLERDNPKDISSTTPSSVPPEKSWWGRFWKR